MDREKIDGLSKDAISSSDWLNTPVAVRAVIIEMARGIRATEERVRLLQQELESYQEQAQLQKEQLQQLKDEIARLKGHNPKPNIKPSNLEKNSKKKEEPLAPG